MKHLLFFKSFEGHNQGYLLAVVRNLCDGQSVTVVSPFGIEALSEVAREVISSCSVRLITIDKRECESLPALLWRIYKIIKCVKPDCMTVMHADMKELARLGLLYFFPCSLCVIEFRVSHPCRGNRALNLRGISEDGIVGCVLWLTPCRVGFLDWSAASRFQRIFDMRHKVLRIPDPIRKIAMRPRKVDKTKFTILVFGVIDGRKNLPVLADAVAAGGCYLDWCVRIVGPVSAHYQQTFRDCVVRMKKWCEVQLDEGFKEPDEAQEAFHGVDVVYLLYRGHMGMSSVLVRAAAAEVPVVAPPGGLLETLVRDYELGVIVRDCDGYGLREALVKLRNLPPERKRPRSRQARFADLHSESAFSRALEFAVDKTAVQLV